MAGIQPFEGETRIARSEIIDETANEVVATTREINRASDSLDDLTDALQQMDIGLREYSKKAAVAKQMMRRLSTKL